MHECSICEKTFTRSTTLRNHISTVHEKQRPYRCSMCTKHLASLSALNRHKRVVHNESTCESEETNDDVKPENETAYEHDLFDMAGPGAETCDDNGNCEYIATFKIHPAPVPIVCCDKYIDWMRSLFSGILDFFGQKCTPDADDRICLTL